MRSIVKLAAAAGALAMASPAAAVVISVESGDVTGFSFNVVGSDITIFETWNSSSPVFLRFSDLDNSTSYTVTKIITNNSGQSWLSLANELLDPSGNANDANDPNPQPGFVPAGFSTSNDSDGLSFAQGSGIARTSDAFATVIADENTDARDFLDFVDGTVASGSTFNVSFGLFAGSNQNQPFLLSQRANARSIPPVPEPGTWAMMLLGFFAVGAALRGSRAGRVETRVRYS